MSRQFSILSLVILLAMMAGGHAAIATSVHAANASRPKTDFYRSAQPKAATSSKLQRVERSSDRSQTLQFQIQQSMSDRNQAEQLASSIMRKQGGANPCKYC